MPAVEVSVSAYSVPRSQADACRSGTIVVGGRHTRTLNAIRSAPNASTSRSLPIARRCTRCYVLPRSASPVVFAGQMVDAGADRIQAIPTIS